MKKATTFFMFICFIFMIVSCGTAGDDSVNIDNSTEINYKDMEGAEFLFNTGWTNEYFPDEGYSDSGDKMRARYENTGELFNCEFNVVKFDEATASSLIIKAVAAGMDIPDLIDVHAANAYPAYKADLLFPLNEIGTIDLSDTKWGPEKFRSYGIWNGNAYGFFSYDWEFVPQFEGCLLFNNELIKLLGMQNPYEMQDRGDWNWKNFKDELILGTQTVDEVAITGLQMGSLGRVAKSAIFSNGVQIVTERDGKYVFGYDSPEAYAALDYLKDLLNLKVARVSGTTEDFSVAKKSVYFGCESWIGTVHADGWPNLPSVQLEDYGFMNFPYGPNGNKDTVSSYVHVGRRLNFVVGVSENDVEDIGMVLDYVFSPLDDSEHEAWKKMSKKSVFHHTEGYENFVHMTENANYDYSAEMFDVRTKVESALEKACKGSTPSEAIDSIKELVQVEIDKSMNS